MLDNKDEKVLLGKKNRNNPFCRLNVTHFNNKHD